MMVARRNPYEHMLGRLPDAVIASLYGLRSRSSVASTRRARGIAPCSPETICRIDWDRLSFLLGWFTDLDISRVLMVSRQSVSEVRTRRGIPARFPSGRRPSDDDKERTGYPGQHPRADRFSDEVDPYRAAFEGVHPIEGLARLTHLIAREEFTARVGDITVATDRQSGAVVLLDEALSAAEAEALATALRAAAGAMRRVAT